MSLRAAPRARAAAASAIIAVLIGGCDVIAGLGQFDNAVEAIDAVDSGSEIATPGEDGQPAPLASSSAANLSSSTGSSGGASSALATTGAADAFAPDAGASEATPDAASDSADAAMDDAAAVTPADAGPPSDAGATWCVEHASPVTFDCHDFDDAASPLAGFTSHFFSGNFASVTSTDYAPGSAPSSLLIATPALDGGSSAINQFNDVLLYHDKLELAFSLKLVSYDSNAGDVSLFRVSYQDNGWAETLDLRGSTATLNEVWPLSNGGTGRAAHGVTMPPLDAWTRIDLVVDLGAHTQSLTYDGASALSGSSISNPTQSNPALFVQSGLNYLGGPAKPMSIYNDDIVVNTPP
jgi:hypothetical protein